MTHYREEELALRAARPEPTEEDPHLSTCDLCRSRLEFLRRVHEEFRREAGRDPDPRIARALGTPRSHFEITLIPFSPDVQIRGIENDRQITLLAAQGGEEQGATKPPAAVLASEADRTLLRITEEDPGAYRFYLLADDTSKQDRVLLGVVTTSGQRFILPTNEHGVAVCDAGEAIEWGSASAVISLPVARFPFSGGHTTADTTQAGDVTLEVHREQDVARFHCTGPSSAPPRRAMLHYEDGTTDVLELIAGVFGIPEHRFPALTEVRLFL